MRLVYQPSVSCFVLAAFAVWAPGCHGSFKGSNTPKLGADAGAGSADVVGSGFASDALAGPDIGAARAPDALAGLDTRVPGTVDAVANADQSAL